MRRVEILESWVKSDNNRLKELEYKRIQRAAEFIPSISTQKDNNEFKDLVDGGEILESGFF